MKKVEIWMIVAVAWFWMESQREEVEDRKSAALDKILKDNPPPPVDPGDPFGMGKIPGQHR